MNRNPVIPFLLIMVFGLGLIFFLSLEGLGNSEEMAKEKEGGEKTEEAAGEFDPEGHYKESCIGCHGGNYEGGAGPALKGTKLSKDEIKDVLVNGKGSMPAGMVPAENADAMAEWVSKLK
ncbi:cytochrome c550 [Bacillus ectoiniformans]|uniref:cytochrome c550 n=1 Tax=Bacillus ectoiniformans TaxID=1494429 RepID=UPI001956036C|nr:cytochrome c [Bacillus ectoiniformans]MBM7650014.1 cytochrome c550 [Bacillus ectoiniformans]